MKDAFAASFAAGEELERRFTLVEAGEVVLDLWAGWADRKRTVAWDETTLAPVFSTTKAVAALMIARLVEAGKLDYDQTVASLWPEFAQAGKDAVTVGQAISHQAGLPGLPEPMDAGLWVDWDAICARLAAMAPMWPPGSASGYHPVTVGYLVGEIFRRVDGRTIGQAFREDLGQPYGLDLWIGLAEGLDDRVAELQRPSALPEFGEINEPTRAAFLAPWSSAAGKAGRLPPHGGALHQRLRHRRGPGPADGRPRQRRLAGRRRDPVASPDRRGQRRAHPRPGPGPALRHELGRGLHAQRPQLPPGAPAARPSATPAGAAPAPSPIPSASWAGPM